MSKTKKLKSGTELPLLNLKGKDYLQVAHRLVWFREEHPTGIITTEQVAGDDDKGYVVFKATIQIVDREKQTSHIIATGHKREQEGNFPDYLEKAETGAVGRALALAGYGTQFEPDLDEGDRLADAPLLPKSETKVTVASPSATLTKISSYARVAMEKKLVTVDDLTRKLKDTYGVDKKEDLSESQAADLLTSLKVLVEGKK